MQKAAVDIKAPNVRTVSGDEVDAFSKYGRRALDLDTAPIKRSYRRRVRQHTKKALQRYGEEA